MELMFTTQNDQKCISNENNTDRYPDCRDRSNRAVPYIHIPEDKKVLMITKEEVEKSDSFLAQGGICVYCGMSQITTVLWRIR